MLLFDTLVVVLILSQAIGRWGNYFNSEVYGQVIEQEITIHAEFPTASERGEIEAAFDSLLLRASQFANRKKL